MLLFTLLSAFTLLLALEWRIYWRILTPSDATLSAADGLLIAWSVWSKTVLMLSPGLLAALAVLRAGRVRLAWGICGGSTALICSFIAFDLLIYESYGRHLLYLMGFLGQPEALEFVGGLARWAPMPLTCVAVVSLAAGAMIWTLRRGAKRVAPLAMLMSTWTGWIRAAVASTMLVLTPLALATYSDRAALFERACAVFPLDPRSTRERFEPQPFQDPVLGAIDTRLRSVYAESFGRMAPAPPDPAAVFEGRGKPNVILIVLESLNQQEAAGGAMPRLHRWGQTGMSLHRHYSGSNHTEPGIFTLLYSRHPWAYHATLDARIPPQACETFRRSGYEVGYFSGINPDWNRLDEFLHEGTFERYEFLGGRSRDETAWAQWDRLALERLRQAANEPRERPLFALCFLNSSHMPYVAPPKYLEHPVSRLEAVQLPRDDYADDRPELLAEYRRALAFLDDEIAATLESLDPVRNIIIVTGDHGESIYHDGTHGHYTRHSEAQTRVPMFIVGPGVPRVEMTTATTHADLLPTLLHLLTGRPSSIAGSTGRDLLAGPPPDEALLCCVRRDGYLELLAIRGEHRLAFDADSHSPNLKVVGFQDPLARPKFLHGQSAEDVDGWVDFVQRQLDALQR